MKIKLLLFIAVLSFLNTIERANAQTSTCLKNVLYPTDQKTILPNSGALDIAFADLNNDGKQDMVIGTYVPYVEIYIQQAGGQFLKTDSLYYNWPSSSLKLKIVDVDNNGIKDILVKMDTGVVIIRNNGSGHILATDTVQQSATVVAFDAGDYNDDGITDLILSTQAPYNDLIYKGIGGNLYVAGDTIAGESFPEFKITDINNDGQNDIVYVSYSGIGFYTKNASDSLIQMPFVSGSGFTHMELQDIDGDGLNDILISDLNGVEIYKNLGGFNFVLHQHVMCAPQAYFPRKDIFCADMNNDGTTDMVIRSNYYSTVFYNIAGTMDSVNFNKFSCDEYADAIADVNADGRTDIIVHDYNDNLHAFYNKSNGFFEGDNFSMIDATQVTAKRKLQAFDFDGDGDKDMFVFGSGGLDIIRNNNDRTWDNFGSVLLNSSYGTLNLTNFVVGNLDANATVDAILPPFYDNNIYVIHDISEWGNYSSMTTMSITNAKIISSADFNSDGKKDLVVGIYAPTFGYVPDLRIYLNDGNGNFPTATYPYFSGMADQYNPSEEMVATDYDHDGKQDVFFHTTGNYVAFCKGTGGTTFAPPVFIDGTSVTSEFLIKDVNNDSYDDFISRGFSDSIKIYLGNATGFTYYGHFSVPSYTADLTMADMNEDGNMDIVASDELNNTIQIYTGAGNGSFALQYSVPFEGGRALLADNLDNDHHIDIASYYNDSWINRLKFYYADTLRAMITTGATSCSDQVLNLQTAASSTINWFNGATNMGLTNINPITVTNSGVYTGTITTNYGCALTTDSIHINISPCDSVWPGDANMNNLCDGSDLLNVGLNYGASGTSRVIQDNTWSAHASMDWGVSTSGLDEKFSDCNGDGMVNANDTLAINLNFSSTHAFAAHPGNVRSTDPMIWFTSSASSYVPGQPVSIDVMLGTISQPVNNLYGIAFDINFDASLIQTGTGMINYPNSWLGSPGTNVIKISKIDEPANTAHGAESRTIHTNADGYGKIATLHFTASSSVLTATPMSFTIGGYVANDSVGNNLIFNSQAYTILLDPLATSITDVTATNDLLVYPNPYSGATNITYTLTQKSDVSIEVYNTIGQKVETVINATQTSGEYKFNFSAKEKGYDPGIYFVKFTIDGKTTMRRIIEMK